MMNDFGTASSRGGGCATGFLICLLRRMYLSKRLISTGSMGHNLELWGHQVGSSRNLLSMARAARSIHVHFSSKGLTIYPVSTKALDTTWRPPYFKAGAMPARY